MRGRKDRSADYGRRASGHTRQLQGQPAGVFAPAFRTTGGALRLSPKNAADDRARYRAKARAWGMAIAGRASGEAPAFRVRPDATREGEPYLAGIAEIVDDIEAAVRFYRDTLGLEVEHESGVPYANIHVPGVLHFGLWERHAVAETVYGDPEKADRIPLGFTVGFKVDRVAAAASRLEERGLRLEQPAKTESWGQTTARFFLLSGALGEVAETPWARRIAGQLRGEEEGTT